MTRLTTQEARTILERVIPGVVGDAKLAPQSIDLIQGVTRYETGYGDKWSSPSIDCTGAAGSNNWGAVKVAGSPKASDVSQLKCPASSFACQDSDAAGVRWWYCFKSYATPDAGAADVVRILWNNKATKAYLLSGESDPAGFAKAMRKGGYFEQGEAAYAKNLTANVDPIRRELGRPVGTDIAGSASGVEYRPTVPLVVLGGSLLGGLVAGIAFSR